MTADRDDLAAILAKHRRAPWEFASPETVTNPIIPFHRCTCGDREVFIESETDLDRHRAQMVLESDWLRGVRAKELRDAADAVYGDERAEGDFSHPLSVQGWLRDRAAGVGTKDGDDEDWPFTKDRPRHLWEGNFTPPESQEIAEDRKAHEWDRER